MHEVTRLLILNPRLSNRDIFRELNRVVHSEIIKQKREEFGIDSSMRFGEYGIIINKQKYEQACSKYTKVRKTSTGRLLKLVPKETR